MGDFKDVLWLDMRSFIKLHLSSTCSNMVQSNSTLVWYCPQRTMNLVFTCVINLGYLKVVVDFSSQLVWGFCLIDGRCDTSTVWSGAHNQESEGINDTRWESFGPLLYNRHKVDSYPPLAYPVISITSSTVLFASIGQSYETFGLLCVFCTLFWKSLRMFVIKRRKIAKV